MNKNELKTRRIAWDIIKRASNRNRRLSDVTAEMFRKEGKLLDNQERRFITMLVQGTVRLSGRLDWELRHVFTGTYDDLKENLRILLRLGTYQLFYMNNVPDYAAVSTTVQLAKRIHANLGGLTNALLRTLIKLEQRNEPDEHAPISILSNYLSHPEWIINKWIKDQNYERAKGLAKWNNVIPKLWFRVNRINYSPTKFKNYLNKNKISFTQFNHIPDFFQTDNCQKILNSEIFANGHISVQDPAAGLVIKLLDPIKPDNILDVCAAPGGKTSYIAEIMKNGGNIIALDPNKERLNRLINTINRLKLTNVITDLLDITKEDVPMTDKMLLDVPCSGTGVMSKRADIRWRRSIDDILEMHLLQRKILWSASKYIVPGGILIYSTCSVEPEENWMVIEAFLKSHSNFHIENAKDYVPEKYVDEKGALFTYPPIHKIDGGYAVRLKKDD